MPDTPIVTNTQTTQDSGPTPNEPVATTEQTLPSTETTPARTETVAKEPTTTAPAGDTDDVWTKVLDLDPDEIVRRNPKLQGKLGDLAAKQARLIVEREKQTLAEQLREQIRREEADRAEQERLRNLRREDPFKYAEESERLEEEQKRRDEFERQLATTREKTAAELLKAMDTDIFDKLLFDLPKPVQERILGRHFPGGPTEARYAYIKAVIEATKEHEIAEAEKELRAKWEKEAVPALEKQVLSKLVGSEPSVDIDGGTSGAGPLENDEWQRNRHSRAWRIANKARIEEALAARRLRS